MGSDLAPGGLYMKLLGIYKGVIKTMCNTPCKIAVFSDGENLKIFQKEFFLNSLIHPNWSRNVVLEKNSVKSIESKIFSLGFSKEK